MSLIGDLFIRLGLKSDDFNKGIDNAQKKTSAFGGAMGKIGGMIAGAFAVGAIFNFGKTATEEFNKAEQGAMRLLTALGGNRQALDMLSNQAKQLQNTTLFEDDETIAAQAAMAMLIKEADTIKKLTPLVQDLATAKGIDLTSAGFMVAKAVEGSGAALQKMGIQVEGTAGSATRLKSVIDGLNTAVGGQAVNAANVGTGSLTQLANAFGNLKEAIGGGISQSGVFKGTVNDLKLYLNELTTVMESEHIPKWKKFWLIVSGQTYNASVKETAMKEADARWKNELAPKTETTTAKPKPQTDAEQLADRIKSLNKNISDTTAEMRLLSAATPEWKTSSDELKGFKDELNELTGATKKQEDADKRAADAKAAYVDRLILQRIEEQKIMTLTGQKITTTDKGILLQELSPRGEGKLAVPETKIAGLQTGMDTVAAGAAEQKAQHLAAIQEGNAKITDEESRFNQDLNGIIQAGLTDAAITFGEGIGLLMAGDINIGQFGASLLGVVGNFMSQLGKLFITTAIGMIAFNAGLESMNPVLMLGAGIALVAAGAAVSSFAKKGMANASASTSGGGGGGSAASGYSGGMQSQSTAAQALSGNVEFVVKGNTMVGVLNNQQKRNSYMG